MPGTEQSPDAKAALDQQAPASRLPRLQAAYSVEAHEQRQLRHALALVTQQCRSAEDQLREARAQNKDLLARIARFIGNEADGKLHDENLSLRDRHEHDRQLVEKLQQELQQTVREKAGLHAELANATNALDRLAEPFDGLADDWDAMTLAKRIDHLRERVGQAAGSAKAAARERRTAELEAEGLSGPSARSRPTPEQTEAVKALSRQLDRMRTQLDASLARNRDLTRRLQAGQTAPASDVTALAPAPERASAPGARAPLSEEARRLVARIRQQVRRLDELGRDPACQDHETTPEHLRHVAGLVETALRSVHTMRADPSDQAVQCASLSCLVDMIDGEIEQLDSAMARQRRNLDLVRRLDQLFAAVRDGRHPGFSKVEQLASEIAADVADHPLSSLTQPYTAASSGYVISHSLNVARLAAHLASQSPRWRSRVKLAAAAALVHDIGMVQVPPDTYDHPHDLTDSQREVLRQHASVGAWVAETINGLPEEVPAGVAQHHERLDGSGYPEGLAGDDIDDLARLVAVVDVYESMTADRPHRLAKLAREAMGEMLEEAEAGRLDREWVEHFLSLSFYPVGSYVQLSTGESARVVAASGLPADPRFASRPVVQLVTDRLGRKMWTPEFVNLANCPDRHIVRALAGNRLGHDT